MTNRHYERKGLLRPARSGAGHRGCIRTSIFDACFESPRCGSHELDPDTWSRFADFLEQENA
jgi:hypothetical protein